MEATKDGRYPVRLAIVPSSRSRRESPGVPLTRVLLLVMVSSRARRRVDRRHGRQHQDPKADRRAGRERPVETAVGSIHPQTGDNRCGTGGHGKVHALGRAVRERTTTRCGQSVDGRLRSALLCAGSATGRRPGSPGWPGCPGPPPPAELRPGRLWHVVIPTRRSDASDIEEPTISVTVIIDMRIHHELLDELFDVLKQSRPETMAFEGCELVNILQAEDDPTRVILMEVWGSNEAFEAFSAWRAERGDTAAFMKFYDGQPRLTRLVTPEGF